MSTFVHFHNERPCSYFQVISHCYNCAWTMIWLLANLNVHTLSNQGKLERPAISVLRRTCRFTKWYFKALGGKGYVRPFVCYSYKECEAGEIERWNKKGSSKSQWRLTCVVAPVRFKHLCFCSSLTTCPQQHEKDRFCIFVYHWVCSLQ